MDRRGNTVWRYRERGYPDVTLPGQPDDEEFAEAYYRARARTPQPIIKAEVDEAPAIPNESFHYAQKSLERTMEWQELDGETKKKNTRLIERFLNTPVVEWNRLTWRAVRCNELTADLLRDYITGIHATNPTVAKHSLNAIKKLLWAAIEIERWMKPQDDPSLSIRVRVPKSTKNPAWPIAIREKFEARHPIGSAARTTYALGFWLGNRRGDVAGLLWSDLVTEEIELYDGDIVTIDAFDFRQRKNRNRHGGKEMFIPIVDKLAEALAPLNREAGGTVLKTMWGDAFSEKSLTNQMAVWTRQAGIPAGYTLHGLRRTFGTYLAECNLNARTIMDALGHSNIAVTDSYVRDANRKRAMVDVSRAVNARESKRDAAKRRGNLRIVG